MIPNLITKQKIPEKIPQEMEEKIKEFKLKSINKEDYLKDCFYFLANRFKPSRLNVILKINEVFKINLDYLWNKKGHIHCTSLNYLFRIMLVKSLLFKEEDIKLKLTNTWLIAPHQYLQIIINKEKVINIDLWAYGFGIKYGDHSHGFHTGKICLKFL